MNLQPLHDFVVIKKQAQVTETASGIVLVSKAESDTEVGTVVAVGPGTFIGDRFDPMVVSVGNRVMFNRKSGQEIEHEKTKYLFLKQRDIMGVIQPPGSRDAGQP
jgi:chaperonin GroES